MIALGIRYLNGFVVASQPDARDVPEWPPHPGRVFMALAAAHFQNGATPEERAALLWLEGLSHAPVIRAGMAHERRASDGTALVQFVPVNDKAGPARASLQSAPLTRVRQARTFARAWVEDDTVYLAWPDIEAPEATSRALDDLCRKVARIGHSSSLVQMWVARPEEVGEPTWVPDEDRTAIRLRLAGPGTLEDLERRYNEEAVDTFGDLRVAVDEAQGGAHRAAKKRLRDMFPAGAPTRVRPSLSLYQGYAPPEPSCDAPAAGGTIFDPNVIVLALEREDGPYRFLDLSGMLGITERWREALISQSNDLPEPVRRLVSGHDPSGAPLEAPHVAMLPLAFVGHPHADGRLLGMGLALPSGVSSDERRGVLRALGRVGRLALGQRGVWRLQSPISSQQPWNLRAEAWTAHRSGATHWSTITPVVFDRHPKKGDRVAYQREVAAMIARACVRIGLPEPRDVIVTSVSAHVGVPAAHAFPRLRRKDGGERQHTHAILIFEPPVRGPILVGAGRYRGYGFCRPMYDQGVEAP